MQNTSFASRPMLALLAIQAYLALTAIGYIVTGVAPFGGFLDEVLILFLVILSLGQLPRAMQRNRHLRQLMLALLAFATIGFVSAAVNTSLGSLPAKYGAVIAIIIEAKIYLVAIAVLALFNSLSERDLSKWIRILCISIAIFGILNAILCIQDVFRGIDIHERYLTTRIGIPSPNGIFDHKFKSAFTNVLALAAALHLRGKWLISATLFTAILMVSLSVKEIFAAAAIITIFLNRSTQGQLRVAAITVIIFIVIGVAATDNFVVGGVDNRFTTFFETGPITTVRGKLYEQAPIVATDYFPLGSGAGTFGSSPSADIYYSPLYVTYGVSTLYGGTWYNRTFLIDTFWPKIIAEYGWIGLFAYLTMWFLALRVRNTPPFANYLFWALLIISGATPDYNYADGAIFGGISFALILWRFSPVAAKREQKALRPYQPAKQLLT